MDESADRQAYLKDKIAYFENNKRSKEYVAHQAKVSGGEGAFRTCALNKINKNELYGPLSITITIR